MKLSVRTTALLLGVAAALLPMTVVTDAQAAAQPRSGVVGAAITPGATYQLSNQARGQCLAGRKTERVTISDCDITFTDQVWRLEPIGDPGFFRFHGVATSKCLAIIANGNVRVSRCDANFDDQWWRLDPASGIDAFQLFNHNRQTCLGASTGNGAASGFQCDPTHNDQAWDFIS